MKPTRLSPPFRRHDAHTLKKLAVQAAEIARGLHDGSVNSELTRGDRISTLAPAQLPIVPCWSVLTLAT